jgi:hypothetical protein
MAFKMSNPLKQSLRDKLRMAKNPGQVQTEQHNRMRDQALLDSERDYKQAKYDFEADPRVQAKRAGFTMKGFPMHETSAFKQKIEKLGRYDVDVSTDEGKWAKEMMDKPSTRSTTWDPETGDQVVKEQGKDVRKKSVWQKAKDKGRKIAKKASKYVPVAKKLISKNVAKLIPYAGIAATAYDAGKINRMMKDEGMNMTDAIKKYYLDIDTPETWEQYKSKNKPPAGSDRKE